MKTVRRNDEILRVSDEVAENLVKRGWKYIAKEIWKLEVRNKKPEKPDAIVETPKQVTDASSNQKPVKKKKHNKNNER